MQMISGTIKNAVQLKMLDNKWQQKKDSGKLTKEERNARDNWTQEDYIIQDIKEQAEKNRKAEHDTKIDNKIMAGGTLTPDEEKYLEQNNPEALKKYKEIKAEKKNYEEKLRKCKTKDEVERVKLNTMGEYAASLKKVINDPVIPKSEKLAKAQETIAKTNNVQEVHLKFVSSPEYEELPTEGEEAVERAQERQAEYDSVLDNNTENVDNSDMPDNIDNIDNIDNSDMPDNNIDNTENVDNTDITLETDDIKNIGDIYNDNSIETDNNMNDIEKTLNDSKVQKEHQQKKHESVSKLKSGSSKVDNAYDEHVHRKGNKKTYSSHISADTLNITKRTDIIIDDIKNTCAKAIGHSVSYMV